MNDLATLLQMSVPRTLVGINASAQAGKIVDEFGVKKALIVSDEGVIKAGLTNTVRESLDKQGISVEVFSDCPESAPISSITACSKIITGEKIEAVIGIGGGSVLDLTKLARAVAAHDGDTSVLFDSSKMKHDGIPMVMLPTTAGTGSEVSAGAVFTTVEAPVRKSAVKNDHLASNVAVLDPNLTLNLPPAITADTGMDALSHAIEAYTCTKANVVADVFAEKAISLVAENLRIAYARGSKHIDVRYNMMLAASYGILAIRSSTSYIVHSFSYPLGLKAHLGHGRACAMTLPTVMEFNLIGNPERYARVAELMGENTAGLTLREKGERAVSAVRNLIADIGLPQKLSDVGIKQSDIPEIVDYVTKYHGYQIETNPREVTRDDLIKILESIL